MLLKTATPNAYESSCSNYSFVRSILDIWVRSILHKHYQNPLIWQFFFPLLLSACPHVRPMRGPPAALDMYQAVIFPEALLFHSFWIGCLLLPCSWVAPPWDLVKVNNRSRNNDITTFYKLFLGKEWPKLIVQNRPDKPICCLLECHKAEFAHCSY